MEMQKPYPESMKNFLKAELECKGCIEGRGGEWIGDPIKPRTRTESVGSEDSTKLTWSLLFQSASSVTRQ